jgi:hypothetical protein
MNAGKGTSLAALLLLVGAAALLSGMLRSIVDSFQIPPVPPRTVFPLVRGMILFTLGSSVVVGISCGIILAVGNEPRIRRFFVGLFSGCALGALAGAQLVSKSNLGMTLIGSVALIVFGLVIRYTGAPTVRPEDETQWFRCDDLTGGQKNGGCEPPSAAQVESEPTKP